MHLILGGRYMGKRAYAEKIYGSFAIIYDMKRQDPKDIITPGLITNLHIGTKKLLYESISPRKFFMSRIELLRPSVIIGDEIGGGVVPVDAFARRWRDETGLLYQALARKAEIVDRVFAGLALRLKG